MHFAKAQVQGSPTPLFMLYGTQRINSEGHLEIGGCDTMELARQFGTPLYVLDEEAFRDRCRAYRQAFEKRLPKVQVLYAGKALLTLATCQIVEEEGLGLDVTSGGELYTALVANFPAERLYLHGNNKTLEELQMALEARVGTIIIDNFQEMASLEGLLRGLGRSQRVMIRVAPAVDPKTHHFIRTGQADTKFGFPLASGDALRAVEQVLANRCFELVGFHCHVGSQLLETTVFRQAVRTMAAFAAEVRKRTGYTAQVLNIGGGLGIRYTTGDQPPSLEEYAAAVAETLEHACHFRRFPLPCLMVEPGRSLIGEAGITLYTVGVIKPIAISEPPGIRTYLVVDGGLSDNPRPQMYGARYRATLANKASLPHEHEYRVVGKHCETDTLIDSIHLPEAAVGDVMVVFCTGAYNYSMSSQYNRYPRPAMVLVRESKTRVCVERESYADLIRQDRLLYPEKS